MVYALLTVVAASPAVNNTKKDVVTITLNYLRKSLKFCIVVDGVVTTRNVCCLYTLLYINNIFLLV